MDTDQQNEQEAFIDLGGVPESEQHELLEELGSVLFEGVMERVFAQLDEEQGKALTLLIEVSNQDPESEEKRTLVAQYLDEHVPDLEQLVIEEAQLLHEAQETVLAELGVAEEKPGTS